MENSQTSNKTEVPSLASRRHRHSRVISGYWTEDKKLHWRYRTKNLSPNEAESVEVRFPVLIRNTPTPQKNDAMKTLLENMAQTEVLWIGPTRKDWAFNLDAMKKEFRDLEELPWCSGTVYIEPDFEVDHEMIVLGRTKYYETYIVFYINPEVLDMQPLQVAPPIEIQQSLRQFRMDYPSATKVAFVMMKFGTTEAHNKIIAGIRDALLPFNMSAVRADDKEYHSDLFYNILTYLYGCGFGIAVFERIEHEDFNPNVSLEVGYLLALKKQVCLLKDKTLKTLPTDLVGKLYRTFDPQDPVTSIPPSLLKWMKDKGIV